MWMGLAVGLRRQLIVAGRSANPEEGKWTLAFVPKDLAIFVVVLGPRALHGRQVHAEDAADRPAA